MQRYNPSEIEPKWQKTWDETKSYIVNDDDPRPKFYHLIEFPYPSGAGLHVGHARSYVAFDVMSRWRRMSGENVLYPIGWDSFGLPAEQYAIKTGIHPSKTVRENIATFKTQAKKLGLGFDWSREFSTADPKTYKWTQWIFLNLFKEGLAYQAESQVWWCEDLKSVLADEEVIDGKSERGDFPCERKPLRQWMLAITKYADRLYDDLDDIDFIEPVKIQQRNWIGRSKGAEVKFKVEDSNDELVVFTTRPDTLFGATYMVLAPEHPLVSKLTSKPQKKAVEAYVKKTASKSDLNRQEESKAKTGVFIGAYAINPVNGAKIPLWISDYVLMGYGTGAIMAVPAHDQRDFEFAMKFNLPIVNVVNPVAIRQDARQVKDFVKKKKIVAVVIDRKGNVLTINWGPKLGGRLLIGGTIEGNEKPEVTAKREVAEETGYKNLKLLAVGDETFYYKYYAFSKNEGHDANVKFVFLELENEERIKQKLNKSEKNNFKVEWVNKVEAEKDIVEPLHKYAFEKFVLGKSYSGEGVMTNSGLYNGKESATARDLIVADLSKKNLAKEVTNFKLRDWVFSRQRYWGEPFPIVWVKEDDYKKADGEVKKWIPKKAVTKKVDGEELYALPIPPAKLPVLLPQVEDFRPQGLGKGPLALAKDWNQVWFNLDTGDTLVQQNEIPKGGPWVKAVRETDTMPNWAGSSWYFLRYLDPNNDEKLADKKKIEAWMPVNWYNGGMEHTTLHLLYSRFWHKFLYDLGVVNTSEPYKRRTSHGIVLAHDNRKMSKSLGNVVDPLEVIRDYGADTLRLYACFIGPFNQVVSWNVNGVAGCRRFIERLWALIKQFSKDSDRAIDGEIKNKELNKIINEVIKRVSNDIPELGFNTAVAALMEAVNSLYKASLDIKMNENKDDWGAVFNRFIRLCAPFMPHLSEELWQLLGNSDSVLKSAWPLWEEAALDGDELEIVVQINGKLRGKIKVPVHSSEEYALNTARTDEKVVSYIKNSEIKKAIYVKDKLINFVI